MILLVLGMIHEHLVPNRRKMDRVDRLCLWTIRCCLVILFLALPEACTSEDGVDSASQEFFFACSGGKLEVVKESIAKHPNWINARTENGEACLHLTGIYGHSEVTEFLLVNGADPNIRSTFSEGLRMHPLSWNIYGGHYDNIDLLLKHGADVNLDFDAMDKSQGPVTAMDVILQLKVNEEGDERFTKLESLLLQHGGKTMKELNNVGEEL